MAVWTMKQLSTSTNGEPQTVVGTTTGTATLIHTSSSGISQVWMWASNTGSAIEELSVEWTTSSNPMLFTLQVKEPVLLIPGWAIGAAQTIDMFSTNASVVNIQGYEMNFA